MIAVGYGCFFPEDLFRFFVFGKNGFVVPRETVNPIVFMGGIPVQKDSTRIFDFCSRESEVLAQMGQAQDSYRCFVNQQFIFLKIILNFFYIVQGRWQTLLGCPFLFVCCVFCFDKIWFACVFVKSFYYSFLGLLTFYINFISTFLSIYFLCYKYISISFFYGHIIP